MKLFDKHDMNIFKEIMENTLSNEDLSKNEVLTYMNYYYHYSTNHANKKKYTSYDLILLNEINYFKEDVWSFLKNIIKSLPDNFIITKKIMRKFILHSELFDSISSSIQDEFIKENCFLSIKELMIIINEKDNSCCDHIESFRIHKENGKHYFLLSLYVNNEPLLIAGESMEEVIYFAKELFVNQPDSIPFDKAVHSIFNYSKNYTNPKIMNLKSIYKEPILYAKDNNSLSVIWESNK